MQGIGQVEPEALPGADRQYRSAVQRQMPRCKPWPAARCHGGERQCHHQTESPALRRT